MPISDNPTVLGLAYTYLARDWGLVDDALTATKCQILRRHISDLRSRYRKERSIPYHRISIRRAYVASYAPRYARLISSLFGKLDGKANELVKTWHRQEVVVAMFGG